MLTFQCVGGKMKNKPLISVIIPVYNVEQYLQQCLDSLLRQTYQNFELILVDDGSLDNSWEIMQDYAKKDTRVRLFRKENGGVSSARNFGLEIAKGDYIAFVDSDDFVAEQYLEGLYWALDKENAKLAVCKFAQVDETAEPTFELFWELPKIRREIVTKQDYVYGGATTCSQCWRALYHRDLLKDIRFDSEIYIGEDTIFFLQAFLKAEKFAYINEKLYFYRKCEDSSYRHDFTMKQYTEVLAWEKIVKMVEKEPEALRNSAEGLLLIAYARIYYRMHNAHCESELQKELIRKARKHRSAKKYLSGRNIWDKGRVFTMLYCPFLGGLVWRVARKIQQNRK